MAINAAALTFAIPAATKVAIAAIDRVGEAVAFQSIFGQVASTSQPAAQPPTLGQQLESLSQNLRQWLSNQGIQSPFEIGLASNNSDAKVELSVQGADSEKIQQLLNQNPDRLAGLRQFLGSIQSLSQSLGRENVRVSITDLDSQLSY